MMPSFIGAADEGRASTPDAASDAPVIIFATFVPKPGHEYEVQRALQAVLPPTRGEPGCLRFDLYAVPDPVTTFRLFEIFTSQQAVAAHRETEHYRVYCAAVIPLLQASPAVTMMVPLDVAANAGTP